MRVYIKKGLSCLLLLALLLSLLPGLSAAAWAEGIEELELELLEITEQEPEEVMLPEDEDEPADREPEVPELPEEPELPTGDQPVEPEPDPEDEIPAEETVPETGTGETEEPETEEETEELFASQLATFASAAEAELRLYAAAVISENFTLSLYIALPEGADPAQYHVKTEYNAQLSECTVDRDLSAGDLEDGLYVIPDIAEARAYQLTAPVEITVTCAGTELRHEIYSVRDYLLALKAADETLESFCTAALCYGGAAQRYLDGRSFTRGGGEQAYEVYPDDLADAGLEAPAPGKPARETAYVGMLPGLTAAAGQFRPGTETALRFYFASPQQAASLTADHESCTVGAPASYAAGIWYADLTGIPATELADDFILSAALQDQTVQVLYSPYCYAAQNWDSSDTALAGLCRMLVAWGDEAAAMAQEAEEAEA